MRLVLPLLLLLTGCGPGLVFNGSQGWSPDEMLARASHVFVGVIESQHFDSWPFFRMPGVDSASAKYWMILRRRVRVELVIRGVEARPLVDIYEIFWVGGASGDWNSTRDGDRALFLCRVENGRYHVVRDWWRSVFPVTTGRHDRLPMDDSHPLWERIALMNWWIDPSPEARISYPQFRYADPGLTLDQWRTAKLQRGLLGHRSRQVREAACRGLMSLTGWGQDECWQMLPEATADQIAQGRQNLERLGAPWFWSRFTNRDERRLLTTVSDPRRRREFCQLYLREYPGDTDNGCFSTDPPATVVTENGDVPLTSPRP